MSVAGAVLLLAAGGAGAAHLDKAVTLSVDGKSSSQHVFGSTVGDLLADQGITLSPDDIVLPKATAPLRDGETVTVKYVRTVNLTVDGKPQQLKTTETTVDGALLALGIHNPGARISASRSQSIGREGLSLAVTTPKSVTVVDAGKPVTKTLTAATVSEALAQLRIPVGSADKVTPAAATPLTNGLKITVQRVTTQPKAVTAAVPFTTVRTSTNSLYKGQTKTSTKGQAGVRTSTVSVTRVDGKAVSSKVVSSTITKAPVNAVVLVGAKARPAAKTSSTTSRTSARAASPSTSTAGLNLARAAMWDRVAACESTGNWSINTGNGYYGGLQFSRSTWLAYGGGQFAPRADLASRAQQITVANRAYADNGLSQWGCKA